MTLYNLMIAAAMTALGVLGFLILLDIVVIVARLVNNKTLAENIERQFAPIVHIFRFGKYYNGNS